MGKFKNLCDKVAAIGRPTEDSISVMVTQWSWEELSFFCYCYHSNELSTVLYNYKALMETLPASNGGTSQVAFMAQKNARFQNGGRGKSVIGIENIVPKKGIENRNTLIFHMQKEVQSSVLSYA